MSPSEEGRGRTAALWLFLICLFAAGCERISVDAGELLPQNTPLVVKIGLSAPFEGRHRALGYEVLYAVKWSVRQHNAAGGGSGYLVELVALNDSDDPQIALAQAKKFAVDERVMGVIGPFSSESVLAVAATYAQNALPLITPATCSPEVAVDSAGGVFCVGASADDLSAALVSALPPDCRAGVIATDGNGVSKPVAQAAVAVFDSPLTEAALQEMRDAGLDLYFYGGDALSAAGLLLQMRRASVDAPLWGGPELARGLLEQIAGDAAAGTCYAVTVPLLADLSADSPFAEGYGDLAGAPPGTWGGLAYDAAELLLDAIARAIKAQGEPTREVVGRELATAQGPGGGRVFAGQMRRAAQVSVRCIPQSR